MRKITFFIAGVLCIVACNNDVIIEQAKESTESQSIELRMPEATQVAVYSEATSSECMIDSIWVLEFNSAGSQLLNYELVNGSKIINKGHATQLLPQLSFKPTNGDLIICIANGDSIAPFTGITKSTINNYFSSSLHNEYYSDGESLPMYGELLWATSYYTCEITRAVAKIQIQMGAGVSDVTGNFTANNVRYKIFNQGKGGYIQPNTPVQGISQSSTVSTTTCYLLQNSTAGVQKNVYLYEYPTSTKTAFGANVNNNDFHANRQYIILEKDNGNNNITYYRLDFYDPATKTFMDIKRNHHYLFIIQKVRSEGYTTLEQAQSNPGSNIEYTITVGDDSKFTKSNGQYAIVTSVDTAYVPAGTAVSDFTIATAKYLMPQGTLASSTINTIAVTSVASGTMSLGATSITALSTSNGNIKINTNASFTEGIVTLTLGNITHHLQVKAK
jgi:hypothetical protein